MLDAAAALFAQSGFDATGVRDVAARADASPGAVNYYFGSKAGLIRAVLKRVADPINEERHARLDALGAGDGPMPVEDIVRAFLEPLFSELRPDRRETVSRLLAHVIASTDARLGGYWLEIFGEIGRRFVTALIDALPHLTVSEVFWRYQFMLMATYDSRSYAPWFRQWAHELFGLEDPAATLDQRVGAFTAMFTAPPTAEAGPYADTCQGGTT